MPCLSAMLFDDSAEVMVKLWDKACVEALGISTSQLKEFWERGVEVEEERPAILKSLNSKTHVSFRFIGTLKLWTFGFKQIRSKAQVNMNSVETD